MTQPGEQWMYDTGSDVLGVLIARASGKPFDVFLQERIFGPLGMKDTAFSAVDRVLTSYSGDLSVYDAARGGQWSHPPAFPSGSGGLVSTVDDYLAFSHWVRQYDGVGTGSADARAASGNRALVAGCGAWIPRRIWN